MNPGYLIIGGFAVLLLGAILALSGVLWGLIQELVKL